MSLASSQPLHHELTFICVDTTHRLIVEGHNCMLFGTTGPDQRFHAIAYGICAHEDEAAHHKVAAAIKLEVEALVAQRQRDGTPF